MRRVPTTHQGVPVATWPANTVWWHVYPLGFTGAEQSADAGSGVHHRLPQVTAWLDYAVELGCNGLALGPVFASETHGYDTVDHFRIDPRLGDDADFDELVSAAHDRGLRILLDGVFNHVGRGFPRFVEALASGPDAPEGRWFQLHWPDDGGMPGYDCFEGHGGLVTLNHDADEVRGYVTDVMRHWLSRGADGWRLDAAYAVPAAFWQGVLPDVRRAHADAWFVGEVIHGDYAGWVAASGADSVTQYELWKAIWSSLNDRNLFELAWALDRHASFVENFLPLTFLDNHDVTRIASQLRDARHLGHAVALLAVLPGVPSIYAGDEQRFLGVKEDRAGGDDAVRPALPARPDDLADRSQETYDLYRGLLAARGRHRWLGTSRVETLELTNEQLALRLRSEAEDSPSLVLVLNLADEPHTFRVEPATRVEASSEPGPERSDGWEVPPHGWALFG